MNHTSVTFKPGPTYFMFAAVIYLVGSTYLSVTGLVWLSVASIGLAFLMGIIFGQTGRQSTLEGVVVVMLAIAAINILVSTDSTESFLRWFLWFIMVLGLGMLATNYDDSVDKSLVYWVPVGTFFIWLAKFSGAEGVNVSEVERVSRLHLSAFFASMTLATGLFHPNRVLRTFFAAVGIYGVLESGSRAQILLLPFQFIFALRQYFRSKIVAYSAAIIPAVLLATMLLYEPFREETFGKKSANSRRDSIEDAQKSLDDRAYLREVAYEFMSDKPLGWGYGNTYSIPGALKNRGNNFHNSLCNIGVPLGVHVVLAYMVFNLWLFWSLLNESRASRLYRNFFLAVLLCVSLRGLTEDFTLFDLGNPVCYLVVYMIFLYLNRRRFLPQRVEI